MSKQYKVKNIGDFLKIPSDRIRACLMEMADSMEPVKANLESLGLDPSGTEIETFTWDDDGKKELSLTLNCKDGSSTTIKISKAEKEQGL